MEKAEEEMKAFKYVIVEVFDKVAILLPVTLNHDQVVSNALRECVISAGRCAHHGPLGWVCYGSSDSLAKKAEIGDEGVLNRCFPL